MAPSRVRTCARRSRRLRALRRAGAFVGHIQRAGPQASALWGGVRQGSSVGAVEKDPLSGPSVFGA
eukprot:6992329-Pyramimonas_sp.AAC.2